MSYLYIGVSCSFDPRGYFCVLAMGSPAVEAITRRAWTGLPGETDRMPGGDDDRLAGEFHIALNPLRKAETQAVACDYADCE